MGYFHSTYAIRAFAPGAAYLNGHCRMQAEPIILQILGVVSCLLHIVGALREVQVGDQGRLVGEPHPQIRISGCSGDTLFHLHRMRIMMRILFDCVEGENLNEVRFS